MTPAAYANPEVVRTLVNRIVADRTLPKSLRRQAERVLQLVDSDPAVAESTLRDLYRTGVPLLVTTDPEQDLCRCVSMSSFFTRLLDDDLRGEYKDAIDFTEEIARNPSPDLELMRVLRQSDPLFPQEHTWMAPCERLTGLTGKQLRRELALADSDPPYALFVLERRRLVAAGVRVRSATSLDAIPAGVTYWDPDGLPTGIPELVDADISRAAVGRIEWRP